LKFNTTFYQHQRTVNSSTMPTMVVFIIDNPSDQICQTRSIQSDEKEHVHQILSPWPTHTIMSLYPMVPQSLWLAISNWLLECLGHMRHGCGLQKSRGFLPWSQIFLRCVRADLDL